MAIHSDVSFFWGWPQKPLKVTVNFQQRISKLLSAEWQVRMAGYLRWAVHSRAMAYRVGRCTDKRQKQIEPFTTWGKIGTWWNSLNLVFSNIIPFISSWFEENGTQLHLGQKKKFPVLDVLWRLYHTLPTLMSLLRWCCWILRSQWLTPVLQLPQKMAGIQCGRPNDKPRTLGTLACWNA